MGLKLEKDAVNTFTLPTWLMAMNFLMKNININYDFNTKFELTTVLNNKLYGCRVECPAAIMMKAVLIAADKAYDLVAMKLGTYLRTNFAVTLEVMNTPFSCSQP